MSISSLLNAFRTPAPQTTAPVTAPGATTNATVPSPATTPPTGNTQSGQPAAFSSTPEPTSPASPMSKYDDLWKAPEKPVEPAPLSPGLKFDPKALMTEAKKVDFTQHISPDTLEKLKSGDAASIAAAINEVGQGAYGQSIGVMSQIVERAIAANTQHMLDVHLPKVLRQHQITQQNADIPGLNTPAAAGLKELLEQQFQLKNPAATPEEISAATRDYLTNFATSVITAHGGVIQDKATVAKNTPVEPDWEKYFS